MLARMMQALQERDVAGQDVRSRGAVYHNREGERN